MPTRMLAGGCAAVSPLAYARLALPQNPAGCYFNLFRLMAKCGVLENLLLKEHTHTFCNKVGGWGGSRGWQPAMAVGRSSYHQRARH